MKTNSVARNLRQGFTLIELLVVIAIIAALASVAYGPILNQLNKGDQNTALQNMKQISIGLNQFQEDYSAFPDDETAAMIQERQPDLTFGSLTGDTSNCYLRQLLTKMDSEKNFYCKLDGEMGRTKEPDDKMANNRALVKGECGFAYVMRANKTAVPSADTRLPILLTPVLETGATGEDVVFDNDSFRDNAFVLRLDQSVTKKGLNAEGKFDDKSSIFPENKRTGKTVGDKYIVLPPDL